MFNYDKKRKYLMACSGGPDSMALLFMLLKENYQIIVAHVNYKSRLESDDEEKLVREFCDKYHLICKVKTFTYPYQGSFEVAARKFRYEFFEECYQEYQCSGLFVAHHKDDLLETYLLKKQRNVINESYLILPETYIYNMRVLRPLLKDFYKEDLLNFCKENNIPYGIDYTNFMDIHPRNVIRKKLLKMDKNEVYLKALEEEKKLIKTREEVLKFIDLQQTYKVDDLKKKNELWQKIFLFEICEKDYQKYINNALFKKLKDFLNSEKPNLLHLISKDYYLKKSYDELSLIHYVEKEFKYTLKSITTLNTPFFKTTTCGKKMQGIYLSQKDFPIIIRSYRNEDRVLLKSGSKKVSRLFIDKKIPTFKRKKIPVIENQNHEIIFVYGLYRKYALKEIENNFYLQIED